MGCGRYLAPGSTCSTLTNNNKYATAINGLTGIFFWFRGLVDDVRPLWSGLTLSPIKQNYVLHTTVKAAGLLRFFADNNNNSKKLNHATPTWTCVALPRSDDNANHPSTICPKTHTYWQLYERTMGVYVCFLIQVKCIRFVNAKLLGEGRRTLYLAFSPVTREFCDFFFHLAFISGATFGDVNNPLLPRWMNSHTLILWRFYSKGKQWLEFFNERIH